MQTWKNVLFQHFEIINIDDFKKYLPKDCEFDSFEGKYYLGLVLMNMTNVRHKSMQSIVWFKNYNELNVRAYIKHKGKAGVLFLSLDVDSIVSILGARILYGLPYRFRTYKRDTNHAAVYNQSALRFEVEYEVVSEPKYYEKNSFAHWATERYFFANRYLGVSFMGKISHDKWQLCQAKATNSNLSVLDSYALGQKYPDVLFCKELAVETNSLQRI